MCNGVLSLIESASSAMQACVTTTHVDSSTEAIDANKQSCVTKDEAQRPVLCIFHYSLVSSTIPLYLPLFPCIFHHSPDFPYPGHCDAKVPIVVCSQVPKLDAAVCNDRLQVKPHQVGVRGVAVQVAKAAKVPTQAKAYAVPPRSHVFLCW